MGNGMAMVRYPLTSALHCPRRALSAVISRSPLSYSQFIPTDVSEATLRPFFTLTDTSVVRNSSDVDLGLSMHQYCIHIRTSAPSKTAERQTARTPSQTLPIP